MALFLNPQALAKEQQLPAVAPPLIVGETSGARRAIVLRGRSLPYRGVAWGGEQRLEVTYFPGNPVAQAQVLGPTWTDTTMRGMWKDAFLGDPDSFAGLLNFPALSSVAQAGSQQTGGKTFHAGGPAPVNQRATTARALRDAFFLIQRAGVLLRVEWGSVVRYGFLATFEADHDREEDIRWEATFRWVGDTSSAPKVRKKPRIDAPGAIAALIDATQEFLRQLQEALAIARSYALLVEQRIRRIGTLVSQITDTLSGFVELTFVPQETLGVLQQQVTSATLEVRELQRTIRSVPPPTLAIQQGGNVVDANIQAAVALALLFNANRLADRLEALRGQLDGLVRPGIVGLFTPRADITLRDVSREFFGTPEHWPLIAQANDLRGSIAPRGMQLLIPDVTQQEVAGG